MRPASDSARRRPDTCCHKTAASRALINAPAANTILGAVAVFPADTEDAALTRSVRSRPGSDRVRVT